MKMRFEFPRQPDRKSILHGRFNDRLNAHRRRQPAEKIQLIYAHFGFPAIFSAAERLHMRIRTKQRAYQLWLAEGCRPGRALNDWLRAEAEVMAEVHRTGIAGRNEFVFCPGGL